MDEESSSSADEDDEYDDIIISNDCSDTKKETAIFIESLNWNPVITDMWKVMLLNISSDSWLNLGKGYLSVEDTYYLLLAFPCFFGFFPILKTCEFFRKFENRHPWVCEKCCKRFRHDDQLEAHNVIMHLQPETMQEEEKMKMTQPFRVKNTVVDFYSQYVSLDWDIKVFYCPLCQNGVFFRFPALTSHLMINHVRYLSACSCVPCRSSPARTYQWSDFLHGDAEVIIYEETPPPTTNCWGDCYQIPKKIEKRCPANPTKCHETFRSTAKDMERMILHLLFDHKW